MEVSRSAHERRGTAFDPDRIAALRATSANEGAEAANADVVIDLRDDNPILHHTVPSGRPLSLEPGQSLVTITGGDLWMQAEAFVYLVSVAGVTGGDVAVDEHLRAFIARARAAIDAPIVVGFGIRTPEQAAAVGELADGVVVGSQFVRTMGETTDPAARVAAVTESARALASALPTR